MRAVSDGREENSAKRIYRDYIELKVNWFCLSVVSRLCPLMLK